VKQICKHNKEDRCFHAFSERNTIFVEVACFLTTTCIIQRTSIVILRKNAKLNFIRKVSDETKSYFAIFKHTSVRSRHGSPVAWRKCLDVWNKKL